MSAYKEYLSKIEKAFNAGNATEHTYRPILKDLIETVLGPGIVATNEPRRVKCGAPDYIIENGRAPIGYVETKDIGEPLSKTEKSPQIQRRWRLQGKPPPVVKTIMRHA